MDDEFDLLDTLPDDLLIQAADAIDHLGKNTYTSSSEFDDLNLLKDDVFLSNVIDKHRQLPTSIPHKPPCSTIPPSNISHYFSPINGNQRASATTSTVVTQRPSKPYSTSSGSVVNREMPFSANVPFTYQNAMHKLLPVNNHSHPPATFRPAVQSHQSTSKPIETSHFVDTTASSNWVFPTNMTMRDYQYNIVQKSLFTNTMVCLPTGLGNLDCRLI